MAKSVAQKLFLKTQHPLVLLNAPENARALLELPEEVVVTDTLPDEAASLLLFVRNQAELRAQIPLIVSKLTPETLFWIVYPKKTSGVSTDLSRDVLWDCVREFYIRPVSQVAIDDVWSALRFKPEAV